MFNNPVRVRHSACIAALLCGVVAPTGVALAQEGAGLAYNFGVGFRLQSNDNPTLAVTSPGSAIETITRLSFGLVSETRSQRLSLSLGGNVEADSGAGATINGIKFRTPQASLAYERSSASARFSFGAKISQSDLSDTRDVDDFTIGTGIRVTTGLSASIDLRDDAPFGFGVFASIDDTDYRNASVGLLDSRRRKVGATARFDLSEVTQATLGLTFSDFQQQGVAGSRDTISLTGSIIAQQKAGNISGNLSVDDTVGGQRYKFYLGGARELPSGSISGTLGVTRGVTGATGLIASLDYSETLPNGSFNIGLSRSVDSGSETDLEERVDRLSLGYVQNLSEISKLSLDVSYARREQTATATTTVNSSFGATYSRELAQDWFLDAGYRYRDRDVTGIGSANSNSVFVELRRSFDYRR